MFQSRKELPHTTRSELRSDVRYAVPNRWFTSYVNTPASHMARTFGGIVILETAYLDIHKALNTIKISTSPSSAPLVHLMARLHTYKGYPQQNV